MYETYEKLKANNVNVYADTLNTFFSIPVFKGDRLPRYDYSPYQVIVFDEIYMSSPFILDKIRI